MSQRIEGACLAMARVMTWVSLEAEARYLARKYVSSSEEQRLSCLCSAIERGLLRLEWP